MSRVEGKTQAPAFSRQHADTMLYLEQKEEERRLLRLLVKSTELHIQFYTLLSETQPSYDRFLSVGISLMAMLKRVAMTWKRLKRSSAKLSLSLLNSYSSYCCWVLGNDHKASLIRQARTAFSVSSGDDLLLSYAENGAAVVVVGTLPPHVGLLRRCNQAFCELSGYPQTAIVNQPLELVIPQAYKQQHTQKLELACALTEFGYSPVLQLDSAFILHKSGYIRPIVLRLVTSADYTNGYCFIGRMAKDTSRSDPYTVHLLSDSKGYITDLSSSIQHPFSS